MTADQIKVAREIIEAARQIPSNNEIKVGAFAITAIQLWPEALDEVEGYQEALRDANKCYAELMQERDKLLAIAEAAEDYIRICDDYSQPWRINDDLENALKAWRDK